MATTETSIYTLEAHEIAVDRDGNLDFFAQPERFFFELRITDGVATITPEPVRQVLRMAGHGAARFSDGQGGAHERGGHWVTCLLPDEASALALAEAAYPGNAFVEISTPEAAELRWRREQLCPECSEQ